jgi:hypothetical protein
MTAMQMICLCIEAHFYIHPKGSEVLTGRRLRKDTLYTLSAVNVTMRTPSSLILRYICLSICTVTLLSLTKDHVPLLV